MFLLSRPSRQRHAQPSGGHEANGNASTAHQEPLDEASNGRLLGYLNTVYVGAATLDQIVATRHLIRQCQDMPSQREPLERDLEHLSRDYQSRGRFVDNHFCQQIPAAVALKVVPRRRNWSDRLRRRDEDQIDISYLPEAACTTDTNLENELWRCKTIYLQALRCRSARRRAHLVRSLFSVFVCLLSTADSGAILKDKKHSSLALPIIRCQRIQLEDELGQSVKMEARQDYLLGMLFGAVALGGLFALAFYTNLVKRLPEQILLGVAVAGSIGAIVSVMARLTSGKLVVDDRAGRALTLLAGSFRPLIGAILSVAIYILIAASIIPITSNPTGPLQLTYFSLAVAFIAGFSERLAQDAITRAGSVIPTMKNPEKSSSAS